VLDHFLKVYFVCIIESHCLLALMKCALNLLSDFIGVGSPGATGAVVMPQVGLPKPTHIAEMVVTV
jgi:hypothetical protein